MSDGTDFGYIKFILYSLIPLIGQLLMRVNEFGGSLDKPWLLIFAIPPFSLIPTIAGKMGFIKHTGAESPLDIYGLIPIIFRMIFILFVLDYTDTTNLFIISSAVLLSILFTNLIHGLTAVDCSEHDVNVFTRIAKSSSDSLIMYGAAVFGTLIIRFIPFVGLFFNILAKLPIPHVDIILESLIWGLGLMMGYLIINMYDVNYLSKEDYCSGKFQSVRLIIGVIAFAMAFGYEYYNYIGF